MFGKIVYIGESEAHVENLQKDAASADLMNVNVIFEAPNQRILGEVQELGKEIMALLEEKETKDAQITELKKEN